MPSPRSTNPTPRPSARPRARSRPYDPATDPLIARWAAQQNVTPGDIAKRLKIPADLLRDWLHRYPEFAAAVAHGQRTADAKVVQALFDRATGYTYENMHVESQQDSTGFSTTHKKKSRLHLPPEVRATIYWLKNRLPNEWRDKPTPPRNEIIARIRPIPHNPQPNE